MLAVKEEYRGNGIGKTEREREGGGEGGRKKGGWGVGERAHMERGKKGKERRRLFFANPARVSAGGALTI
jgi:hypothetical protein